jgi:hypothetical protein
MGMKACCSCRDTIAGFTLEEVSPSLRAEQQTMSKVTVYVGLDYHKDSVQVCIMDPAGKMLANRSCPNSTKEIDLLVAFFGDDIHGAIEACSGAAELADELITRHGWDLSLAHPGYVKRMKQSPDKSDYTDGAPCARLVA